MANCGCKITGGGYGEYTCPHGNRMNIQPPQSPDPRDEQIAEMGGRCSFLQGELARWQSDYYKLQARVQELEALCNNLSVNNDGIHAQLDQLKAEVEHLNLTCEEFGETTTYLSKERDAALAEVERLKAEWNQQAKFWNVDSAKADREIRRLREALQAVNLDSIECKLSSRPKQYFITEWAISKVRQALAAHSPVDNADAPAPSAEQPATMKSEQDSDKFHEICPTHEQMHCLEAVACAAEKAMSSEVVKRAPFAGYSEALANLREALARLRDSGWRG